MLVDLRGSVNVTGHAVGEHGGTPPGGWSHLPPRRQAACHHREQHRAEIDGGVRTAERSGVEPWCTRVGGAVLDKASHHRSIEIIVFHSMQI